MGLEFGENLGRLVNGEVDRCRLSVADLVESVTLVGALAAKMHRVDLVLGAKVLGGHDATVVTLARPLELGFRVSGWIGHAGEYHLGILHGDGRVRCDARWSRFVTHSDLDFSAGRVILALATRWMDGVDGTAGVVAGVLGGHARQAQDRALDAKLRATWE